MANSQHLGKHASSAAPQFCAHVTLHAGQKLSQVRALGLPVWV